MENSPETITIYVLCHKHIQQALRAVRSIVNQEDNPFEVEINLMVNTNSLTFLQEVKDSYEGEVLHSWSNGATGAGKNACIRDWVSYDNSRWMMIVDGDDWLYPYALWHIAQVVEREPNMDYLGLQSMDMLYSTAGSGRQQISKKPELYMATWDARQENLTELYPRKLWMKDLVKRHSVARIMLMKRDAFVQYSPEDMLMYEDMVVNAELLCKSVEGSVNFQTINCSGIYIADATVKGMSETNIYKYDHQTPYEYHVRPLVERYGNLNYAMLPFMKIHRHPTVTMLNKITYLIKTYNYGVLQQRK